MALEQLFIGLVKPPAQNCQSVPSIRCLSFHLQGGYANHKSVNRLHTHARNCTASSNHETESAPQSGCQATFVACQCHQSTFRLARSACLCNLAILCVQDATGAAAGASASDAADSGAEGGGGGSVVETSGAEVGLACPAEDTGGDGCCVLELLGLLVSGPAASLDGEDVPDADGLAAGSVQCTSEHELEDDATRTGRRNCPATERNPRLDMHVYMGCRRSCSMDALTNVWCTCQLMVEVICKDVSAA